MAQDLRGLPITTPSNEAAQRFDETMASYLAYGKDTADRLKTVLAADPDFMLANVVKGYLTLMFGKAALVPKARESVAAAERNAKAATPREQAHLNALRHWCDGDLEATAQTWEQVLAEHPRDVMALKLLTQNLFWRGQMQRYRDDVQATLQHWEPGVPGYGYLLGMLAFGHEECGNYAEAEQYGRDAVHLNPRDHWATHAVAHVMEMQGRQREGVDWLDAAAPHWVDANNFVFHLWWHRALFHLEQGQTDTVLALYDRNIYPEPSEFYVDLQNAASMLWRLELWGVDVGERWAPIAAVALQRLDDLALPFTDLHLVLALVRTGHRDAVETVLDAMRRFAAESPATYAPAVGSAGVPVTEGLLAFGAGDYATAVERLQVARPHLHQLGASHAQRDVFELTLDTAALRAGEHEAARQLLVERTNARPTSAWSWRSYADALEALGQADGARQARATADRLLAG